MKTEGRIETEHAGAKNRGGHWGSREEAKRLSRSRQRGADKRACLGDRIIGACIEPLTLFLFVQVASCGAPTWTPADTKSATDAVHLEIAAEEVCAESALDAGACTPAMVRSMQRSVLCSNSSMLFRHGAEVPDAGFACRPK